MASPNSIRIVDDLKSALILSATFAFAAAVTVPGLLPYLPADARSLPLPVPLFCAILAVQMTVVYGLLGLAGFRLARRRGMEPSNLLTSLWAPVSVSDQQERPLLAFALGLCCGGLLIIAVLAIQRLFPDTLPASLHPPVIGVALLASLAGSFGEEILFRLFVISLCLAIFPSNPCGRSIAVLTGALAFGAAHAPAFVFLFGGWSNVPPIAWVWLILLNGACGVAYGCAFLRWGILSAIAMHFGTDLVWHVASQASA